MTFNDLGLDPKLVAKLAKLGISEPTPIQQKAIPLAMEGRDVMGLAQTGTGKTAAFGLPMVHKLTGQGTKPEPKTVRGLILAPTRELAKQILDNLRAYTAGSHLKIALVVGGASVNAQVHRMQQGADLLVATPGRLIDLMERKAVRLDQAQFLVLDEADQMLDLGFIHALRQIAPKLPKDRQTMLFSATMPKQMAELSAAYLTNPMRVEAAPPGKPAEKVSQALHFVEQSQKAGLLAKYLGNHRDQRAIVFCRTKHGSDRVMKGLDKLGFAAAAIHGNKSQGQRDRALKGFKTGEIKVLVATDVAARGLDIPGVENVYNYDLPNVPDNYVHRIGRTARAGASGRSVTFCAPAEMGELKAIQKIIGKPIEVIGGEAWEVAEEPKKPNRRRGSGRPNGGKPDAGKANTGEPGSGRPRRRRTRRPRAA